ncbi:SOS response-associated peptidase family protein, partial [Klebsiella pneumoniae]|uniref:SOS response-associated peptidase family protein n=1 Tax=Klebsiella pneumoniae TaxID=573 RepID=UPI0040455CD1
NGTLAALHERMPAILPPEAVDRWLDLREVEAGQAAALCRPCPEEWLTLSAASRRVNDHRNDDPGLLVGDEAVTPPASPPPA